MERYVAVLCRAEGAVNVGASCRALFSMGVTELRLAACPDFDPDTVRTYALGAFSLYERAGRFASLKDALSDLSLAAGLSRRMGRRRKESVDIRRFAEEAAARPGRIGLVFGNERDGLSDEELALCDLASHIPSSELFPSLNLSHAVQLCFWELRKAWLAGTAASAMGAASATAAAPADRDGAEGTARRIADILQDAGFYKIAGRADQERFLSSVMARAGMSPAELGRLEGIFTKFAALSRGGRGDGDGDGDGA